MPDNPQGHFALGGRNDLVDVNFLGLAGKKIAALGASAALEQAAAF